MYSQDSKDKALGMLRLTGDVEKTARMSACPAEPCAAGRQPRAKPQQRTCGAKFEPYGDEVRGKAMEMARKGASCRGIAEALGIGSPDVVRYWLKGGGTKGARMSGGQGHLGRRAGVRRLRGRPRGEDSAARAGERHPEGSRRSFKSREPRLDEQHGEDRADQQAEAGVRPPR